ncbi:nuclear transport factor 2 family protein [Actinocorallia populi]|uniref:nuclear transport factor 2 family protein n=1 Tax=Actinocorallia populi TaxID=2079200 RepID=UPI000D089C7B|nr:nuclear transport factor 2 family protein [Actinocorallia populi]
MPTPRDVFEHMRRQWLGPVPGPHADLLADDVVIETPFAPPGRPSRIQGREAFLAYAGPQRAALPVRFEAVDVLAVHDTADPEVIVVEYTITGALGEHRATAPFIGVLRARDGLITHWREYQNPLALALLSGA